MCYKSLYISLLSSVKQQGEITKFCFVYGTWTTTASFFKFPFRIEHSLCIFSFNVFVEPLTYPAELDNGKSHLQKYKSIFY